MELTAPPQMSWWEPRPFVASLLVYMVVGYALYCATVWQVPPPGWALDYIEQLKPTVKALETASRLSEHPFPAQVMIVYTAISDVLLTILGIYAVYFVKETRPVFFHGLCYEIHKQGGTLISRPPGAEGRAAVGAHALEVRPTLKLRLTWFFTGVTALYIFCYSWPTYFYLGGGQYRGSISRLVSSLFSSSILSCTLLLVFAGTAALLVVICPLFIYLSTRRTISSHQDEGGDHGKPIQ